MLNTIKRDTANTHNILKRIHPILQKTTAIKQAGRQRVTHATPDEQTSPEGGSYGEQAAGETRGVVYALTPMPKISLGQCVL